MGTLKRFLRRFSRAVFLGGVDLRAEFEAVQTTQVQTQEIIMAVADDLKAAIAALDVETTKIGETIALLASKITNSMSDADVTAIKTALVAHSDRLKLLAVDPTAPVPPEPPPVVEGRRFAQKR